ncbi:hypothetical protein B0H10DRAFT_2026031 [Mycena sp. CBHHK59/15]|nr:hypothetical protein B0H10DRAFT_2026031 [Mycena sp. CBHHK59/15]
MSTVAEFKKLTVPQLKSLCKERRITGYSKLGKSAIIELLAKHIARHSGVASGTPSAVTSCVAAGATTCTPGNVSSGETSSSIPESSELEAAPALGTVQNPSNPSLVSVSSASNAPILAASPNEPVTVSNAPRKKRKNISSSEKPTAASMPTHFHLTPRECIQSYHNAEGLCFQERRNGDCTCTSTRLAARRDPVGLASNVQVRSKPSQKRFVPLLSAATNVPPVILHSTPAIPLRPAVLYHLEFCTLSSPVPLSPISLPPSLSQRKRVHRFAVFDLGDAVYLSAFHRLARDFPGRRLKMLLEQHPQAMTMTNMWPYLEQRAQELSTRKQQYLSSFLNRLFPSCATGSILERLWTSPDHEKQIVMALRFLLTRLFFRVSVGDGKGGQGWQEGQIVDAQQLVEDEVWKITIRHSSTSRESFYVLEPTCEPLTATADSSSTRLPVRSDWSAYIAHRLLPPLVHKVPPPPLMEYLSWTNHEEYERGISRLWLKRIEAEGEIGAMKRRTAERYIFACVVGNSLSGRWMSSTQMAQDFAGLSEVASARVKTTAKVNLFLPAHHHVESMHFTSSGRGGKPLHDALAVVQTPGREYFILRDNEEGVAEVWMNILGCDNSGIAVHSTM